MFSKIRVRGNDEKRHLLFVSENGSEALQSAIDLQHPEKLQVAYTKYMFCSHLFRHPQERILIVGLGGGGMVRFAEKRLPGTQIEAVEIDPKVVALADQFFETRPSDRVKIHTQDAFVFLAEPANGPYDVIYMDAFLRPSIDSDIEGKTGRLKTVNFLKTIQQRLDPENGMLVANLITYRDTTKGDISALKEVFAQVITVPVDGTGNLAIYALQNEATQLNDRDAWLKNAQGIAGQINADIPFSKYAEQIRTGKQ